MRAYIDGDAHVAELTGQPAATTRTMAPQDLLLRQIEPDTIQRLTQQYNNSHILEGRSTPSDPASIFSVHAQQQDALLARRHMIPHGNDGLSIRDADNEDIAAAHFFSKVALPQLKLTTPIAHLEEFKKHVNFVAVSKKQVQPGEMQGSPLQPLSCEMTEVFWVAGQTEDQSCYIAKSQSKLTEATVTNWEDSKWGFISKEVCRLVLLDVMGAAWVPCASPL